MVLLSLITQVKKAVCDHCLSCFFFPQKVLTSYQNKYMCLTKGIIVLKLYILKVHIY